MLYSSRSKTLRPSKIPLRRDFDKSQLENKGRNFKALKVLLRDEYSTRNTSARYQEITLHLTSIPSHQTNQYKSPKMSPIEEEDEESW